MTISPAAPDPCAGLQAIERRFLAMRRSPPDLREALCRAFVHVGGSLTDPRLCLLYGAGLAIAATVDAEIAREAASGRPELPYHNRHHFVEATLAMGWLCAIARARGVISLHQAVLGVVAMVGHDYGHDGSWNQTGELERAAADAIGAVVTCAGVYPEDALALRGIILATALPAVRANKARAAEQERAGHRLSGFEAMHLMAGEADVLSSLMPGLGCRLGHFLAKEWAANPGFPPLDPSRFTGRVTFLRLHDYLGDAARQLGLSSLQASQIAAFRRLAARAGGDAEPEAGAALLDRMPRRQAARTFAAMLRVGGGPKQEAAPIRSD